MKKATVWAHDKFGLKIKGIWQFYQVASFDEERENLEERRKGSKKRTPGVHAEGLRHVVVGACVEPNDLVVLRPFGGGTARAD